MGGRPEMSYDGDGVKVRLELSLKAQSLLVEEYPTAEIGLKNKDGKWYYEGVVGQMEGVGRFCIGLADHVKVVDSPELEEYIKDFVKRNL